MIKKKSKFSSFNNFVRVAFPPEKILIDPFLSNFYRPVSTRISWALINTKITPNFITLLQIVVGILACTLIGNSTTRIYYFIGIIFLHFAYVLDCVDGEIARANKMASLQGVFLDKFAHFVTMPAIIMSVSIYYSRSIDDYKNYLLLIAFISSFATFNPVNRLITSITSSLVNKNDFNQYNFKKYFNSKNINNLGLRILDDDSIKQKNIAISLLLNLKSFAKHFFRHVTYLAFVSILFILEIIGVPYNVLIIVWSLFMISIVFKEFIFLYFVLKSNLIEKRFLDFINNLNSLDQDN